MRNRAGAPLSYVSSVCPTQCSLRLHLHTSTALDSLVACSGILTAALVSMMGQARIYVVLGRERLLPAWLATIHAERKTPVNATLVTAISGGAPSTYTSVVMGPALPRNATTCRGG